MARDLEHSKDVASAFGITNPMDRPWLRFIFRDQGDYPDRCDSEQCSLYGIVIVPHRARFSLPNKKGTRLAVVAQCPRCETIYYQPIREVNNAGNA